MNEGEKGEVEDRRGFSASGVQALQGKKKAILVLCFRKAGEGTICTGTKEDTAGSNMSVLIPFL